MEGIDGICTLRLALQRGLDHVVEDGPGGACRCPAVACFNGASTTWSRMAVSTRRPSRRSRSFNGASTTWSRMVVSTTVKAAAAVALQRGLDHVVEDGNRSGYSPHELRRFNGASTTWSRMVRACVSFAIWKAGFNGASTTWSRMVNGTGTGQPLGLLLQRGLDHV